MESNVFISVDTKAILLLCGVFGKDSSVAPLTQTEYTSLVRCLIKFEMRPGDLLKTGMIADVSMHSGIEKNRLELLLARGVQLGFAAEEWQRSGIWVISRSEPDYPERLKKHLKDKAPPLLFGIGNPGLLAGGGIAIVGSRNVDRTGEMFARKVARQCAIHSMPVVSGGARGVDQIAMKASIEAGGNTIGVLADSLLRKSLEKSARISTSKGKMLLVSPYHPKAGFSVGTAMARNKFIYAMADYGLVVSAETGKGGTWAGAKEELSRKISRPVFVRIEGKIPSGNNALLDIGAIAWPEIAETADMKQQLAGSADRGTFYRVEQQSLFDNVGSGNVVHCPADREPEAENSPQDQTDLRKNDRKHPSSVYDAVLPVILGKLDCPLSSDELAELLEVSKVQLSKWLKRAVEENVIKKLSRPVRYARHKD